MPSFPKPATPNPVNPMTDQPQPVDLSLSEGHTEPLTRDRVLQACLDPFTEQDLTDMTLVLDAPAMRAEIVRLRKLLGLVLRHDRDGEVIDCLVPDQRPEQEWSSLGDMIRAALSQEVSE